MPVTSKLHPRKQGNTTVPKLDRNVVEVREAFALNLFKAQPELSIAQANEEMKKKFHSTMRTVRMYELRRQALGLPPKPPVRRRQKLGLPKPPKAPKAHVQATVTTAVAPVAPITTANRAPGEVAVDVLPIVVHLTGLDLPGAVSATLDALRQAGLTNLTVGLHDSRYVLIDRAP